MKTSIDRDKIDEIIMKIKIIEKNYPATKITQNEANEYIEIIKTVEHKEKENIIAFLENIKITTP